MKKPGIKNKLGDIFNAYRLSPASVAVVLKIFEDLPEFSSVLFHSSTMLDFTIKSRSEIKYLKQSESIEAIKKAKENILKVMQAGQLNEKMLNAWKMLINSASLFHDGFMEEKDFLLIARELGIE